MQFCEVALYGHKLRIYEASALSYYVYNYLLYSTKLHTETPDLEAP